MKDLIEYIVKNIVSNPDAVSVEEERSGDQVNLLLSVDPVDMGLIIGKSGQTIRSLRRVLTVRAMQDDVRVNLQLNEPEGSLGENKAETIADNIESEEPTKN